eukprot:TRINITY_DN6978_c0_g2_i1.p1 TRINITY_DN6978_c0_g2~~TRINITY_DN6978_c0_g2_i1.p1  ORF type:complete len:145 (+),score=26.09 TRINITY_DN6978_c0_g2_i1:533-967(+)
MQYIRHFGDGLQTGIIEKHNRDESLNPVKLEMDQNTDWYQAFKNRCKGDSSQLFISNRAFCKTCKSPIWLRSHCAERGDDTVQGSHQHIPKPMIPAKVLHYLLGESMVSSSSSSDSDSEGELFAAKFSKLWARPRFAYEAFDAL